MKIIKILNNSIVLAEKDNGEDVVVMGKAIGYNNKIGNRLDSSKIEKIYVLEDQSVSENLIKLMEETPAEYLEITRRIVEVAEKTLGLKLFDSVYVSLTDHLHLAVIRFKSGITLQNRLLWEVKKFYPKEFEIGLLALKEIESGLGLQLPEEEAGNIAFHIVNAQNNEGNLQDVIFVTTFIKDVTKIINHYFAIELDTNSINYSRFVTHLQFLAQRLLEERTLDSDNFFLYDNISSTFAREHQCTLVIKSYIEKSFKFILTKEEQIYLTIHISRLLMKSNE
ncbi:BglG family transcription antiterminator LicT [Paenibacillus pabuli]|uniref:BglG family transcription antiterminator LicT n=1 Tax=Paenibacillus pabuli TaxID=1472 RepID=UPI001FFE9174|nr:PRD domain-containing protein [Paenibacillus pabuli]UPK41484.1 PRD domain-containing protein [Paenibacillus pabuli]